jgi:hypothetical protein
MYDNSHTPEPALQDWLNDSSHAYWAAAGGNFDRSPTAGTGSDTLSQTEDMGRNESDECSDSGYNVSSSVSNHIANDKANDIVNHTGNHTGNHSWSMVPIECV